MEEAAKIQEKCVFLIFLVYLYHGTFYSHVPGFSTVLLMNSLKDQIRFNTLHFVFLEKVPSMSTAVFYQYRLPVPRYIFFGSCQTLINFRLPINGYLLLKIFLTPEFLCCC